MNYLLHLWHACTAAATAFVIWACIQGGIIEAGFLIMFVTFIEGYLEYSRK